MQGGKGFLLFSRLVVSKVALVESPGLKHKEKYIVFNGNILNIS